jgi:hypothetical protein
VVLAEWDRVTRSMLDGIKIIERVAARGAMFKALDRKWLDLTTPMGPIGLVNVVSPATLPGSLSSFHLIRQCTFRNVSRAVAPNIAHLSSILRRFSAACSSQLGLIANVVALMGATAQIKAMKSRRLIRSPRWSTGDAARISEFSQTLSPPARPTEYGCLPHCSDLILACLTRHLDESPSPNNGLFRNWAQRLYRFRFSPSSEMIALRSPTVTALAASCRGIRGGHSMRRFLTLLTALAIAGTLVVVAPAAQQERTPLTANAARAAIGLPVFSSDGKQLGKVVAEGIDEDDQPVIVAEFERPLGIAPHLAAIPAYMLAQRPDRIVLTITAEEVANRLFRAQR